MKENENKCDAKQNILLTSAPRAKRGIHRELGSEDAALYEQAGALGSPMFLSNMQKETW